MQQRYGDQVRFVGMPGLAQQAAMERFVADAGVDAFPHIPDGDGALWERFGIRHQRTYVFINDDGAARTGGYGDLAADVEELVAS
ncbi:MAG: hypothetical protein ACR2QK_18555 [Acidimicrobiales bacterium]